ncbi:unnamed protein product, partial [Didymodactylos carnosus]
MLLVQLVLTKLSSVQQIQANRATKEELKQMILAQNDVMLRSLQQQGIAERDELQKIYEKRFHMPLQADGSGFSGIGVNKKP